MKAKRQPDRHAHTAATVNMYKDACQSRVIGVGLSVVHEQGVSGRSQPIFDEALWHADSYVYWTMVYAWRKKARSGAKSNRARDIRPLMYEISAHRRLYFARQQVPTGDGSSSREPRPPLKKAAPARRPFFERFRDRSGADAPTSLYRSISHDDRRSA